MLSKVLQRQTSRTRSPPRARQPRAGSVDYNISKADIALGPQSREELLRYPEAIFEQIFLAKVRTLQYSTEVKPGRGHCGASPSQRQPMSGCILFKLKQNIVWVFATPADGNIVAIWLLVWRHAVSSRVASYPLKLLLYVCLTKQHSMFNILWHTNVLSQLHSGCFATASK
jgi:hypothetical protein